VPLGMAYGPANYFSSSPSITSKKLEWIEQLLWNFGFLANGSIITLKKI